MLRELHPVPLALRCLLYMHSLGLQCNKVSL